MNRFYIVIASIFILLVEMPISAQHYSLDQKGVETGLLIEHYDKGLLLLNGGSYFSITKTDINGVTRWKKYIGGPNVSIYAFSICTTSDGGVLVAAKSNLESQDLLATFIKLNACGELEWCKVFDVTNGFQTYSVDMVECPDKSFKGIISFFHSFANSRTLLISLDNLGNNPKINYVSNNGVFNQAIGLQIVGFHNDNLTLMFDPHQMTWRVWGEIDSQANLLWSAGLPGFVSDTEDDDNERIYISGEILGIGYSLAALSKDGDFYYVKKLWDNSFPGPIELFGPDLLLVENSLAYSLNPKSWIGIVDTSGVLLSNYLVDTTQASNPQLLVTTNDEIIYMNRPLLSVGIKKYKYIGPPDYLSPAQPDLSIRTYDSLCSETIQTDTIFLEGEVIVDLKEQNSTNPKTKLAIWPVPAGDWVHIGFVEGFKINDILLIYNEIGILMETVACHPGVNEMELNISRFAKGAYFVVLKREDNIICTGKITH